MKKRPDFKQAAFVFLLCFFFAACSSIGAIDLQKRHYRKGFYVESLKSVSASEKQEGAMASISPMVKLKQPDSVSVIIADVKTNETVITTAPVPKINAAEKKTQQKIKNPKSSLFKVKTTHKLLPSNASVPGWLSDAVTIFLFTLVCLVLPPYWFYFLGFVYMIAKNKKKSTLFVLAGIADTVGLIFTIVLLVAGSALLLPVYLITLALGLFALTFALIRYFSL
ncbi:MAG: hypothetical protein ABIQ40_09835 [Bacteroidia bacterium]